MCLVYLYVPTLAGSYSWIYFRMRSPWNTMFEAGWKLLVIFYGLFRDGLVVPENFYFSNGRFDIGWSWNVNVSYLLRLVSGWPSGLPILAEIFLVSGRAVLDSWRIRAVPCRARSDDVSARFVPCSFRWRLGTLSCRLVSMTFRHDVVPSSSRLVTSRHVLVSCSITWTLNVPFTWTCSRAVIVLELVSSSGRAV